MQIHQLQPKHKSRGVKRVGRGGKKGTYSGRGNKGQSSRSGRKMVPMIRELIKRYPKLRGYRQHVVEKNTVLVSLDVLDKKTKDGDIINPENLIAWKIVRVLEGKKASFAILANGKLTKKLTIENCRVSAKAREAIEKAGGTVK